MESLHVQSRSNSISIENIFSSSSDDQFTEFNSDKTHPILATSDSSTCYKLLQINHFSIYWNSLSRSWPNICNRPFSGRTSQEIQSLMSRTIANRTHQNIDRPKHSYILLPVDINIILDVSFNTSTGDVKVSPVNYVDTPTQISLCDTLSSAVSSEAIYSGHISSNRRQTVPRNHIIVGQHGQLL